MADKSVQINVEGVREVQRALKRTSDDLKNELKKEFLGVAEDVAARVRSRVPRKVGTAAASVKPKASNLGAAVAAGGRAAPYYHWLDFGGSVGRGHRPRNYWSGAIQRTYLGPPKGSGRYLYPTISEYRDETAEAALDAVENAARRAGMEVR